MPISPPASRATSLAYRMQSAAPEAFDINRENPRRRKNCTASTRNTAPHFAAQCLTARRMVERGVRFVQIYSGGMENQRSWDGHMDIKGNHTQFAPRPTSRSPPCSPTSSCAAPRHTLVIWCGEFGRLPVCAKGQDAGPRPQSPRLHRVDGRRRREGRRQLRRNRRARPQGRGGQGLTCTISTPPFCIC
jgi:hypothetical protein